MTSELVAVPPFVVGLRASMTLIRLSGAARMMGSNLVLCSVVPVLRLAKLMMLGILDPLPEMCRLILSFGVIRPFGRGVRVMILLVGLAEVIPAMLLMARLVLTRVPAVLARPSPSMLGMTGRVLLVIMRPICAFRGIVVFEVGLRRRMALPLMLEVLMATLLMTRFVVLS